MKSDLEKKIKGDKEVRRPQTMNPFKGQGETQRPVLKA